MNNPIITPLFLKNSMTNSFIMSIAIVPLQGDQSEALPVPVHLKLKFLDEHERVREDPREQSQYPR